MKNNFQELCDYFAAMPGVIGGLASAVVGDDELIEQQSNTVKYPALWVETPDLQYTGSDDDPAVRFDYALVVLTNEPIKTGVEANKKLSQMELLLRAVYNQMLADADADEFTLILKTDTGSPIRRWSGDNCYGWRLEVSLEIPRTLCT